MISRKVNNVQEALNWNLQTIMLGGFGLVEFPETVLFELVRKTNQFNNLYFNNNAGAG